LFTEANVASVVNSDFSDIRDLDSLLESLLTFQPEIVFHLAAQPLVRASYEAPIETYTTNIMGTVNLLEATRKVKSIKALVNVTTDKCYENKESLIGYLESDAMGGYDPYSCSKGCSELITASYQRSFFPEGSYSKHQCAIASARAGNVIGGGDWAIDRLIPDMLSALSKNEIPTIRNPNAIRPWQHVLEPLSGYLILAEHLFKSGPAFNGAWNFGPNKKDAKPVHEVAELLCYFFGENNHWQSTKEQGPHEATYLTLDCTKAKEQLQWEPKWNLDTSLALIVEWQKSYIQGRNMKVICNNQIEKYFSEGELYV
jgi:CDP-glucose 4,6-dehydratase